MGSKSKFHLHEATRIIGTPALAAAVNGWKDLLDNQLIDLYTIPIGHDNEVIWFETSNHRIVSLIMFAATYDGLITIMLGWTHPKFRRRHLYKKLFDRLVEITKTRELRGILGTTSVHNVPMNRAMKSFNRTARSIIYIKEIGNHKEAKAATK